MPVINYFFEDIDFSLKNQRKISKWISNAVAMEGKEILGLNYIFCSDQYLLELNQEYLKHQTFTDIITFDHSEDDNVLEGDVFISIDRVIENAKNFDVAFEHELKRVIIHGVLHLIGYKDKSKADQKIIREKENKYLNLWGDVPRGTSESQTIN